MHNFQQLVLQAPPMHQAVLLALGALVLLAVALHVKRLRDAAERTDKRQLRRRMSSIGMTTLVSEIETNLSIPVQVLKLGGHITRDEFAARLQERIKEDPFFARYRSLVVNDEHTFVEVPDFDVNGNVFAHTLRDGETALEYVETLVNTPLDFSKPLWEVHVIEDPAKTEGDITNVLWKVHHCIGDGAAGATALVRLSDNKDQFDAMIRKLQAKSSSPKPAKPLAQRLKDTALFATLCLWSAYVIAKKTLALVFRVEPVTMFKKPGGTAKHLSYTVQYSVATTKQIGRTHRATVNDVMLSCVAGAMRKTMLAAGQTVPNGLVVRAAVPVDMRATTEVITSTNNKFSALVLDLPVGESDRTKRLQRITRGMNEAKNSLEKHFTYALSHVVAKLPTALMKAVVRFTGTRMSVAISNVRGSSLELSMCGKRVVGFFGFVPPPPTVNLGIAILSVGDDLGLNVLVDPSVGIDSKQFLEFAQAEYEALHAQVLAPETKASDDEPKKDK